MRERRPRISTSLNSPSLAKDQAKLATTGGSTPGRPLQEPVARNSPPPLPGNHQLAPNATTNTWHPSRLLWRPLGHCGLGAYHFQCPNTRWKAKGARPRKTCGPELLQMNNVWAFLSRHGLPTPWPPSRLPSSGGVHRAADRIIKDITTGCGVWRGCANQHVIKLYHCKRQFT